MVPTLKQQQFLIAMEAYNSRNGYKAFNTVVSLANISLQIYLLYQLLSFPVHIATQMAALFVAYIITDFVNGLVHMFMDQQDRYDSIAGPLIANFHLHHKTPLYKKKWLPVVYFNETGSKVWLIPFLLFVAFIPASVNPAVFHILVYTGILSSVAEVSHYLCHSSNSSIAMFLAKAGLLLSKKHHAKHHMQDNVHYAFLNGVTDPLLNRIATKYSRGYKRHTDLHFAQYTSPNLESR